MADAIVRTVYRKVVSRRHLLEWVTAARAERSSKHDRRTFLQFMWAAEAIALAALVLGVLTRDRALPIALPFLVTWALSPLIALYVSRRRAERGHEFAPKDVRIGHIVARRTWRFFETFVGDEDHWLPPDNFQEDPRPITAHRTSPTNIGLLLLSTIAAFDLGYLGLVELVERLELTLNTLEKLQKFRGHFFNWHDTKTLTPLWPQYVSVVDSGNLAGHLIALKQACLELPDHQIFDQRVLRGLADTVGAIRQELSQLAAIRQRTDAITIKQLSGELESCSTLLAAETPDDLEGWINLFDTLTERATVIDDIVAALTLEHRTSEFEELRWWTSSLLHEVRNYG